MKISKLIKSGSPITKEDVVGIIRDILSRQDFEDFYGTVYEDYITGVAETTQEKVAAIQGVDREIEIQFKEIMLLVQRIEQLQPNTQSSPVDEKVIGDNNIEPIDWR